MKKNKNYNKFNRFVVATRISLTAQALIEAAARELGITPSKLMGLFLERAAWELTQEPCQPLEELLAYKETNKKGD